MTRKPIRLTLVVIAAFALLVAACGSASDKVAEKLTEELIEASADGEVDIDVSGDGDDATIKIETDEGSMSIGVGTEMPDGLEIPVPDGGEVMTTLVVDDVMNVSLSYDGPRFDEIVGFYESWTNGTGDEWETQTLTMDIGEGTQRTSIWIDDEGDSMILVADCAGMGSDTTDMNAVCVTVTQGS